MSCSTCDWKLCCVYPLVSSIISFNFSFSLIVTCFLTLHGCNVCDLGEKSELRQSSQEVLVTETNYEKESQMRKKLRPQLCFIAEQRGMWKLLTGEKRMSGIKPAIFWICMLLKTLMDRKNLSWSSMPFQTGKHVRNGIWAICWMSLAMKSKLFARSLKSVVQDVLGIQDHWKITF